MSGRPWKGTGDCESLAAWHVYDMGLRRISAPIRLRTPGTVYPRYWYPVIDYVSAYPPGIPAGVDRGLPVYQIGGADVWVCPSAPQVWNTNALYGKMARREA